MRLSDLNRITMNEGVPQGLPHKFMWHPQRGMVAVADGSHHTHAIWSNAELFGADPEEIAKSRERWTGNVAYDAFLLDRAYNGGWCRVTYEESQNEIDIEAKSYAMIHPCAVFCAERVHVEVMYVETLADDHDELTGRRLELFLKRGQIVPRRAMVESDLRWDTKLRKWVKPPVDPHDRRARAKTRSREFAEWFRGSKVVDSSGKPLLVYRGDFPGMEQFHDGAIYLSDRPGLAKYYTRNEKRPVELAMTDTRNLNQTHGFYRCFVRMVRPLVIDADNRSWGEVPVPKKLGGGHTDIGALMEMAVARGHDGIIVHNVVDQHGEGTQYVVPRRDQIWIVPDRVDEQLIQTEYPVVKNPGAQEFAAFLNRTEYRETRGVIDANGNLFLIDATNATHSRLMDELNQYGYSAADYDDSICLFIAEHEHSATDSGWQLEELGDYWVGAYRGAYTIRVANLSKYPTFVRAIGKGRVNESKLDYVQAMGGDPALIYLNPSRSELAKLVAESKVEGADGCLRAWLGPDRIYVWNAARRVLHYHVREEASLGIGPEWIPMEIWGLNPVDIRVTDSSQRTNYNENPETAEVIRANPYWKRIGVNPKTIRVDYWNQDIVGDWQHLGEKGDFRQEQLNRAKSLGFDTDTVYYHGTTHPKNFTKFQIGRGGVDELGPGVYLSKSPDEANWWAGWNEEYKGRLIPCFIRKGPIWDWYKYRLATDAEKLRMLKPVIQGYLREMNQRYTITDADGKVHPGATPKYAKEQVLSRFRSGDTESRNKLLSWGGFIGSVDWTSQISNQICVFRPEDIRSIFAKFKKPEGKLSEAVRIIHAGGGGRDKFPVLVNPSPSEFQAMLDKYRGEVRLMLHEGTVYVWGADYIHWVMMDMLELPEEEFRAGRIHTCRLNRVGSGSIILNHFDVYRDFAKVHGQGRMINLDQDPVKQEFWLSFPNVARMLRGLEIV